MSKFKVGDKVRTMTKHDPSYDNRVGVVTEYKENIDLYVVKIDVTPEDDFFKKKQFEEGLEFTPVELKVFTEEEQTEADVEGALERLDDALDRAEGFRTVTVLAADLQAVVDALRESRG
jgi:hypothetical protein